MADTPPQWNEQRQALVSVVREAARKARVASTFLPVKGAAADDDGTVASLWTKIRDVPATLRGHPGVARQLLETRSGKDLHLITLSSNVVLSGADVKDLDTVKSILSRHAEVLARLEDAIVFYGLPKNIVGQNEIFAKVKPQIYTVSGGSDFTGLLKAPETYLDTIKTQAAAAAAVAAAVAAAAAGVEEDPPEAAQVTLLQALGKLQKVVSDADAAHALNPAVPAATQVQKNAVSTFENNNKDEFMAVRAKTEHSVITPDGIIDAVVEAVTKLNGRRSGPYAAVFGNDLYRAANKPTDHLVLPSTAILAFLDGGPLLRSGLLPHDTGLVVALGGDPIELVLGSDMDVSLLPQLGDGRFVLRVFERLVLRIKELDAVCRIVKQGSQLMDGNYKVRTASK